MGSKYAKPIMVQNDIYQRLLNYRDENNLKSFTEAIKTLLNNDRGRISYGYPPKPIVQGNSSNLPAMPQEVKVENEVESWEN